MQPNGVNYLARDNDVGATGNYKSESPAKPPLPVWFRMERHGDVFSSFYSKDGNTFAPFYSMQVKSMPNTYYVGLSVSSHLATTASAEFSDLTIASLP